MVDKDPFICCLHKRSRRSWNLQSQIEYGDLSGRCVFLPLQQVKWWSNTWRCSAFAANWFSQLFDSNPQTLIISTEWGRKALCQNSSCSSCSTVNHFLDPWILMQQCADILDISVEKNRVPVSMHQLYALWAHRSMRNQNIAAWCTSARTGWTQLIQTR